MAGKLTTHALDTVKGCGAQGLKVDVDRVSAQETVPMATVTLDIAGRGILIAASDLTAGRYRLTFHMGDYRRRQGALEEPPFFPHAIVEFDVGDSEIDYHVPLIFSPFSYSTYRGG